MNSSLKFFNFDTDKPSDCGEVLEIEFSSADLSWPDVVLEQGSSPHFYPKNVYTPYFYFALSLERDLHWSAETAAGIAELKTNPGDIWINPPKTPFSHDISEPCHFVILAVTEQAFLESCSINLRGKPLQFLNNYNVHDETIKGIMELFLLEAKAGGRNGFPYLKSLLSLLSTHYVLNYSNYADLQGSQRETQGLNQAQVDKVDQYLLENLSQNITVDDLADMLNCSKFYFLREFKKLMGITPYQYLINKRMEQAKLLLSTGPQNIAAVSLELGFNDQSHFTRVFKKQFGMTPGQFQKSAGR